MPLRDDRQHEVPGEWRETFHRLADAFSAGDFCLEWHHIEGVERVDASEGRRIANNVRAYGDQLSPLHEDVWKSSVCIWMGDHWQLLVDLTTANETVSDLVLHATLIEGRPNRIDVQSVHVP
jgi:hypothetical protein